MIPQEYLAAFGETLQRGGYNLLLGSGVTLDSTNRRQEKLPTSDGLRLDLCKMVGASEGTPLTRVSRLLSDAQRTEALTLRFSQCTPGPSLRHLPFFLWRSLYTFNIDDVFENLFATTATKQTSVPFNYDEPFEQPHDRSELSVVHLHGWVRKPNIPYVFSTLDYADAIRRQSPWMHVLSEILATEPFIIAGTSLNEPDLEYYLSHRTASTPRRTRGPSILIQPNPDIVTKADCKRHGLIPVAAEFGQFLEWVHSRFPNPPNVVDLVVPDTTTLFQRPLKPHDQLQFFSDFELVHAAQIPLPQAPSRFMYGREPDWRDIDQHFDIERDSTSNLIESIRRALESEDGAGRNPIIILDEAGSGKTTIAKRVGHDLALAGLPVLNLNTASRINPDAAKSCLRAVSRRVLLLVDGIADHAEQIVELLRDPSVSPNIAVLEAVSKPFVFNAE